jgi:hypothetical protein
MSNKPFISIQEYSDKTFVVRGDTKPYKSSLKNLGGKWNSRLAEKDSEEKFGAWLFFNTKRDSVDEWFAKGCPVDEDSKYENRFNISSDDLKRIERKLDMVLELLNKNLSFEINSDDDMEEFLATKSPRKRLL